MAQRGAAGDARRLRNGQPTTPVQAVRAAMEQLSQLTGRPADSVSGLERTDDGWRLEVDIVELERVPASTSVLATYDVQLDQHGTLTGYRRTRRYFRNQAGDA